MLLYYFILLLLSTFQENQENRRLKAGRRQNVLHHFDTEDEFGEVWLHVLFVSFV